ncbi:MAG: HNH endonuclease [Myxococcales bacterium]|nr:HNH endonuclease [Myxococcales bacterium]MCB9705245.1 HNH endonuclease [Myxococcales bacterium]
MRAALKNEYDTLQAHRERDPAFYLARRAKRRELRRGTVEARLARFREITAHRPLTVAELLRGRLDPAHVSEFHFYEWNVRPLCAYCGLRLGRGQVTRDHVIPRARGGPNTADNLVPSCAACNQRKGCKPLLRFLLERN